MCNIFRKMDVASRVAPARAVERTDRTGHAPSQPRGFGPSLR
jgi:hypothetical protein